MTTTALEADYHAEIATMLEMNGLAEATAQNICEPQVLFLTEEYMESPIRVLIMGQETAGVEIPLHQAAAEGMNRMIERQRESFEKFNFGMGYSGPFWRAYDEVCRTFGLTSRRAAAWTNICKVQLIDPISGSVSVEKLGSNGCMEVVNWQRMMARAEMRYAQPDVIVMFTGGMKWMARHLYKSDPNSSVLDVDFVNISGCSPMTVSISAEVLNGALAVSTYHPNGGRTAAAKAQTKDDRELALEWLRDQHAAKTSTSHQASAFTALT